MRNKTLKPETVAIVAALAGVASEGVAKVSFLKAFAPLVIPVQSGVQLALERLNWIPACAGMTKRGGKGF